MQFGTHEEEQIKWMTYVGLAHAEKPKKMSGMKNRCSYTSCQHTTSAKRSGFFCNFDECPNAVDPYCCKRYVYTYLLLRRHYSIHFKKLYVGLRIQVSTASVIYT
jgi:hypothetical protein